MAQIQAAQAQLSALNGGTTTTTTAASTGYTFNTNLTVGSTGADVLNLQKVLNSNAATQVASTGAGSPGNESTYFGQLTKAAVIKFQTLYGISPAAGYVGALTRAKLNSMNTTVATGTGTTTTTYPAGCTSAAGYSSTTGQPCSGTGTTTTTLPTGGNLTVQAGVQPMNSLAPESASRVPFTTITLTAGASDVTVNSITVQRSGLAQDAVFDGIVLIDSNGLQVGIAKTLNSNHQAMIGEPFVIPAGTSQTFTIAGNMDANLVNYAGEVAGLDVVAINTSATVAGSLPITGAQQTINATLKLGSISVNTSSYDPNNAGSQPIGTTGFRFSAIRLTAGSAEDVTLHSIRWNQTGSVGSTDLANVVTIVNGTSYPTTVSADGKYFTSVFPSGIVITKGNSVDAYIQGDIVGSSAAGRTSEFDIYKNTDIYLTGNTYGYGIIPPTGTNTATSLLSGSETVGSHGTHISTGTNPWFEGSTLSVTAGSVTLIGKANEVAAQNIAVNVSNQPLGGFATNFSGEPVSVQSMPFTLTTSSDMGGAITSVTLVDQNGAVVAGPQDATYTSGSGTQTLTFTDTVTFPIGRAVYTLEGKLPSTATNGQTVVATTNPSSWGNVTGQTTGNTVSLQSATSFSMNTMTVKGAQLSVNISAQPTSQNVVAGVQNFVLANYTLDASQSGEDVRLSALPVTIQDSNSISDLTGCALFNGSTQLNTGSRVWNYTGTATTPVEKNYSFDNSLVIPKGTVTTLSLECNVSSAVTSANIQAQMDQTYTDYNVTGQTSGNTVGSGTGLTLGTANGGTMAIGQGNLAMSIDPSSPSYTVINGGATGVTVDVVKLHASNEDMNLTKLGLIMPTGYGSASDLIDATIWNGSTQVGSMQFTQNSSFATSTLTTPVQLPKDTDVLLTIKADFASVGISQSGTEGKLVKVDPLNAQANGLSSGATINAAASQATTVAGVRVFKSYPTLALDTTLPSNGLSDGRLMLFKVTASSAGPVGLSQMKFTVATSTNPAVNLLNVALYAYTDSAYSSPVSSLTSGQFGSTLCQSAGTCSPNLTFTPSTPLQVPAGSTLYFKLYASVTGGSASGAGVTTVLSGDSTYPAWLPQTLGNGLASTTYYVATSSALSASNFVWSGNATSTSGINDVDWSNGTGLSGFPSSGLVQSRGN